jgi:DNA-binding SARP family transcriptional activator
MGCFKLSVDTHVAHVPLQAQRLVAYLAVAGTPMMRHRLAGTLWPFTRQQGAHANLRTAVWRVRNAAADALDVGHDTVQLGRDVVVDYRRLLDESRWRDATPNADAQLVGHLKSELLPGWDEDWLTIEREHARQICMRRLEQLSHDFLAAGRIAEAIDTAFASIDIEPLRESAHLALIEAHIADGNRAEAAHQAERVKILLRDELGISPSTQFQQRLETLGLTPAP